MENKITSGYLIIQVKDDGKNFTHDIDTNLPPMLIISHLKLIEHRINEIINKNNNSNKNIN